MVYGIGYGGAMPLHGPLAAALHGRHVFGRVMGLPGEAPDATAMIDAV